MPKLPSPDEITEQAKFIVEKKVTVREAAKHFKVSKSTIHVNCTKRLKKIDQKLYKKVRKIMDNNMSERHLRGGQATKKRWENKT